VYFNSYALRTPAGVILVDPLRPAAAVVKELAGLGEPIGIFLTNANHDREAGWFRKQYEIQIYAHEAAKADCDTTIDVLVLDGETLPGGVKTLHLPGASAGECALYSKTAGGLLLLGDILVNPAAQGLALLPEQYLEDRAQAITSLQRLRDLNYQVATFAHGTPLATDAKAIITKLLNQLGKPKRKP
jgi:glyoxylase-like metal-dependent hydrolase (beta-lactamase superfamily II)